MLLSPFRTEALLHSLDSVSLARVKEQIRILDTDEDILISSYIQTSTAFLELWTGYDMMPAGYIAYFNGCTNCRTIYLLAKRPFNSITKIEVLQEGIYVELTTDQYVVTDKTWQVEICIDDDVEIDCDVENGCQTIPESVKIEYTTGLTNVIVISDITTTTLGTPNLATELLASAHNLKINDQIINSDTTTTQYDGTFTVTITSAVEFTFLYSGTDPGNISVGNCTIPLIPRQLELAIMQMVAKMYRNRGDCCDECGDVPCMAQALARQFKRVQIRGIGRINVCSCG